METAFFFYTSYVEQGRTGLTESQYHMYLDAIVHYGTAGTYVISDPAVEAIFTQVKYSIDSSKKRYEKAKKDGKKGGRPEAMQIAEIEFYTVYGPPSNRPNTYNRMAFAKEMAKTYNCSERTILRKISSERLKELGRRADDVEDLIREYYAMRGTKADCECSLNEWLWQNGYDRKIYVLYDIDEKEWHCFFSWEDQNKAQKGHNCLKKSFGDFSSAYKWYQEIAATIYWSLD